MTDHTTNLTALTPDEAARINGGSCDEIAYAIGYAVGWLAGKVVDAFLTPSPEGDFNWARDK
jgi:hypothetical protein